MEKGVYHYPSEYGSYAITKQFIEDGSRHLINPEELHGEFDITVLQGMLDDVVPWRHSASLVERAKHERFILELIKDGDHSLSRDQDLQRLFRVIRRC